MADSDKIRAILSLLKGNLSDPDVKKRCHNTTKDVLINLLITLRVNLKGEDSAEEVVNSKEVNNSSEARDTQSTVQATRAPGERVCKAMYSGRACPDPGQCLFRHPKACTRQECKTRRDEDCTEDWHTPVCKSVKRLTRCPNGDDCTARHPATCDTKGCSTQSGCALWHPKTPRPQDPKAKANTNVDSGNAPGRKPAYRSDSSRAKSSGKGKGTYVTRQLAENVRMREKIATMEQKREQFFQQSDFPPLRGWQHPMPSNQPPRPQHSLQTPTPSYHGDNHMPTKGPVPLEPRQDVGALLAALLPLLQALLPQKSQF